MEVICLNEPSKEAQQAFMASLYRIAQRQAREIRAKQKEEEVKRLKSLQPCDDE